MGYPKFFTPNGDGIHDAWNVLGIETLTDPNIFIFDRYGKLLKQLDETYSRFGMERLMADLCLPRIIGSDLNMKGMKVVQ